MSKTFLTTIAALVASALFAPFAQAVPIIWQLQNVTFADGGTASGSFSYDADIFIYSSINIVTTAGSIMPSSTYTIYKGGNPAFLGAIETAGAPNGSSYFQLALTAILTNAGGTIPISAGSTSFEATCDGSGFCFSNPSRVVTSGSVSSTPEPATAALTVAALLALAITRRRSAA